MNERNRLVFEYAILRVVPRVERGECLNVGVLVYCQPADLLVAAVHLDRARLAVLAPDLRGTGESAAGEFELADHPPLHRSPDHQDHRVGGPWSLTSRGATELAPGAEVARPNGAGSTPPCLTTREEESTLRPDATPD